jgi:hypothetical protein
VFDSEPPLFSKVVDSIKPAFDAVEQGKGAAVFLENVACDGNAPVGSQFQHQIQKNEIFVGVVFDFAGVHFLPEIRFSDVEQPWKKTVLLGIAVGEGAIEVIYQRGTKPFFGRIGSQSGVASGPLETAPHSVAAIVGFHSVFSPGGSIDKCPEQRTNAVKHLPVFFGMASLATAKSTERKENDFSV